MGRGDIRGDGDGSSIQQLVLLAPAQLCPHQGGDGAVCWCHVRKFERVRVALCTGHISDVVDECRDGVGLGLGLVLFGLLLLTVSVCATELSLRSRRWHWHWQWHLRGRNGTEQQPAHLPHCIGCSGHAQGGSSPALAGDSVHTIVNLSARLPYRYPPKNFSRHRGRICL